jgi:hypothetical protein
VRGGRTFYTRRAADQDQAILYVKKGEGPEEVLVDPHGMSPEHSISANFLDVSPTASCSPTACGWAARTRSRSG